MYSIELAPAAQRQLKKLPASLLRTLLKQIQKLSHDPRPTGFKKLVNHETLYRIRVNDYRIIYTINDKQLLILIVKIGSRKEVYRML
jgi:mRNA interferase RelE/StbE